jgi:hypothetical protein
MIVFFDCLDFAWTLNVQFVDAWHLRFVQHIARNCHLETYLQGSLELDSFKTLLVRVHDLFVLNSVSGKMDIHLEAEGWRTSHHATSEYLKEGYIQKAFSHTHFLQKLCKSMTRHIHHAYLMFLGLGHGTAVSGG